MPEPAGNGPVVQLDGVGMQFAMPRGAVEVLRDVSLRLAPGDAVAITGPSGSGKSTLLHILGTLERPTTGSVVIGGRDPFALAEADLARFRNQTLGFVFQQHHLLPQLSLLDNVLLPALAAPRDLAASRVRAAELLERVGLGHRTHHRPTEISGGEAQRVAVARALINRPRLLLCDEPTGNLDAAAAHAVADLLFDLHATDTQALVVVTHSLDLAARFSRRVELTDGGLRETSA